MGYSLWGCKQSDTTKQLIHTHIPLSLIKSQESHLCTLYNDILLFICALAHVFCFFFFFRFKMMSGY